MAVIERTRTGPFTWADLAHEPDDGLRREIIGGNLVVNPSPVTRHQRVVLRLATTLAAAAPPEVEVFVAPTDWRYDEHGVVVPDLMVVASDGLDLDGPLPATVVPRLVVEVLSPSNAAYDRLLKRDLYEGLGVPSYWLVDPGAVDREPSIEALDLGPDGTYAEVATAAGPEQVALVQPYAVAFAPADLLAPHRRA